jgi:hypothetical protein
MRFAALILVSSLLSSCATIPASDPQAEFMARLSRLCGATLEGRIVSPPVAADQDFAGKRLVMHVRDCRPDEIRIPFHVGDDRSRTWVVSRLPGAIRLKHDHRHADGSEDALSQYGGTTVTPGTARRQEFPADAFSKDLFVREKRPQSTENVWAMEAGADGRFAYELRRPGRFFRVEFGPAKVAAAH